MRARHATSPFSLFSFQDIITCVSGIIILITLLLVLELVQRKQGSPQVRTEIIVSELRDAIAMAEAEVAGYKQLLEKDSSRLEDLARVPVDAIRRDLADTRSEMELLATELSELDALERKVAKDEEKMRAELFDRIKGEQARRDLEARVNELEQQLVTIQKSDQLLYNPTTPDGKSVWVVQIDPDRILVARAGQKKRPEVFENRLWKTANTAFSSWLSTRSRDRDFLFILVRPDGAKQFEELRSTVTRQGFAVGFDLLGKGQVAIDPEIGATL